MSETTQINKIRQKKLRSINKKLELQDKPTSSYFYPKNNLYTRKEFELLDSIYSDDPSGIKRENEELVVNSLTSQSKKNKTTVSILLKNSVWFLTGALLTSVIWLIYFQLSVHHIKSKHDTQIVFQQSAQIVTDKTVDTEVSKRLEKAQTTTGKVEKARTSWFNRVPKKETRVTTLVSSQVKYYQVVSGDTLWTIAQKYYSIPSNENISKIMKANNMKKIGLLQVGQKLAIP